MLRADISCTTVMWAAAADSFGPRLRRVYAMHVCGLAYAGLRGTIAQATVAYFSTVAA